MLPYTGDITVRPTVRVVVLLILRGIVGVGLLIIVAVIALFVLLVPLLVLLVPLLVLLVVVDVIIGSPLSSSARSTLRRSPPRWLRHGALRLPHRRL